MRRCAFLSLDDAADFVIDDVFAIPPLADCGWTVDTISWRNSSVVWQDYDAVAIRSTWDYVAAPDDFLRALERIEARGVPLFNNLDLVRWNIRKTYLRELAKRGVPVVPTLWRARLDAPTLHSLVDEIGTAEIVIKPVIGLNAGGVFRVSPGNLAEQSPEICACYTARAAMVQPFSRMCRRKRSSP